MRDLSCTHRRPAISTLLRLELSLRVGQLDQLRQIRSCGLRSLRLLPPRACHSQASTARSEASAKLKATLSAAASSSDKASSQRSTQLSNDLKALPPGTCTERSSTLSTPVTPVRRTSAPDGSQARQQPTTKICDTPDENASSTPLAPFRHEAANLPAIPVQAFALSQQNGGGAHPHLSSSGPFRHLRVVVCDDLSLISVDRRLRSSHDLAKSFGAFAKPPSLTGAPPTQPHRPPERPCEVPDSHPGQHYLASRHQRLLPRFSQHARQSSQMRALPQQHHGLIPFSAEPAPAC